MTEMAASSPVGANKLLFNPNLGGRKLPGAEPEHPRALPASTCATARADVVRAGMEGIAMNLAAVLGVLRRYVPLAERDAHGGRREQARCGGRSLPTCTGCAS